MVMAKATGDMPKHRKTLFIIAVIVIVIMALAFYFIANQAPHPKEVKVAGLYLPIPTEIDDFKLKDTHGKAFSKQNLKGHWTLMFFGFTSCGMVCPTTLSSLNQMYLGLQGQLPPEQLPQVMLVSVDPDRDSITRIKEYVTAFNPKFTGARADMTQIEALEKQLHLISVKMQGSGSNKDQYTINHSAEIMVFNPDGKLQAYLSYPHDAGQMALDYKSILHNAVS
jgi:protein SCO1/2